MGKILFPSPFFSFSEMRPCYAVHTSLEFQGLSKPPASASQAVETTGMSWNLRWIFHFLNFFCWGKWVGLFPRGKIISGQVQMDTWLLCGEGLRSSFWWALLISYALVMSSHQRRREVSFSKVGVALSMATFESTLLPGAMMALEPLPGP